MTPTQFQTFMTKLDESLAEIGHELSEDEPTAENCRLFLQAIIRKVRIGFMQIGKQVEPMGARSASKATQSPSDAKEDTPADLYYQNQHEVGEMFQ